MTTLVAADAAPPPYAAGPVAGAPVDPFALIDRALTLLPDEFRWPTYPAANDISVSAAWSAVLSAVARTRRVGARLARGAVWMLAGAGSAAIVWLLVVPWNLSEVDAAGRSIPGGGDDSAPLVAVVYVVIVAVGIGTVVYRPFAPATALTAGGTVTWAALFAWRAGTARVVGANMFLLPLAALVIPAAVAAPLIAFGIAYHRRRRSPPPPRST